MTTRQRIIVTYSARLEAAVRRHAKLNDIDPHAVRGSIVARLLADSMGCSDSPYWRELDAMTSAQVTRVMREVIRRVEDGIGVRRDTWAKSRS